MSQPPQGAADGLLTTREVSGRLRVSINTVHRLAETGQIASYRIGRLRRFAPAAIEDYLQRTAEGAAPTPLRAAR